MWGSKREWTDCEVYGERRSPGRDDQGFAAFGSSDEHVAEGVGFEPTVTCATMVFETIRFGRSRIPPGEMLRHGRSAPSSRKELLDERRALVAAHTTDDGDLVVQPRVGGEVVERAGRTGTRIGRAE